MGEGCQFYLISDVQEGTGVYHSIECGAQTGQVTSPLQETHTSDLGHSRKKEKKE